MNKTIAVIKGDGIGPEIVSVTLDILDKTAKKFGHTFTYQEVLAGGCAIDAYGQCLPQETLDALSCQRQRAVRRGRRPQMGSCAGPSTAREGAAGPAQQAGTVCQPSSRRAVPPIGQRLSPEAFSCRGGD